MAESYTAAGLTQFLSMTVFLNNRISQCSVATCLRCGGIFNNTLLQIYYRVCQSKNSDNRSAFDELTGKSTSVAPFWIHSVVLFCLTVDYNSQMFCITLYKKNMAAITYGIRNGDKLEVTAFVFRNSKRRVITDIQLCTARTWCSWGSSDITIIISSSSYHTTFAMASSSSSSSYLMTSLHFHLGLLWPLYGIGQAIIFFALWFLLLSIFYLSFFPRLILAVADWMSAILPHMVWPQCEFRMQVWNVLHAARWKYRMQKVAKNCHLGTIAQLCLAISSQLSMYRQSEKKTR